MLEMDFSLFISPTFFAVKTERIWIRVVNCLGFFCGRDEINV